MARATFGGGTSDWTFQLVGGGIPKVVAANLTFWPTKTGGSRYTDLLLNGSAVTSITTGSDGQIPEFQGPDGVLVMWADGGGSTRVKIDSPITDPTFLSNTIASVLPTTILRPSGGDDFPAISTAGASGTAVVELAGGTFQWNSMPHDWWWTGGFTLRGQGIDETIIQLGPDVESGPRWGGWDASEPQVGPNNPISSAVVGQRVLTTGTNLTASLAAGDWIVISTAAYFAARPYYNVAEWAQVDTITATTLTLKAPLRRSYSTADTIQIHRYPLISDVRLENVTIKAHPSATVRQKLAWFRRCDTPVARNVRVEGTKASVGLEVWLSITPKVEVEARNIRDLANLTVGTWEGYGVRTMSCLDADVVVNGRGCRHLFDDASETRMPPSLRTRVRGIAYDCVAAGFSTHGGSDECLFDGTTAVGCGGGYTVRGRGAKGRKVSVLGVKIPTTDEYTALGGTPQSNKHGINVGEGIDPGGGVVSPAGTALEWDWDICDMMGGDSTCEAIHIMSTDVTAARFNLGRMTLNNGVAGLVARYDQAFRDTKVTGGQVTNTGTGTGRVVYIEAQFSNIDGRAPQNVDVENLDVNGYAGVVVNLIGNSVAGANASRGIRIRNNKIKGRDAGYGTASSVIRLEAGYFDTAAGSVEIIGNEILESTAAAVKTSQANGNAGLGTSLSQRGNRSSSGYDAVVESEAGAQAKATAAQAAAIAAAATDAQTKATAAQTAAGTDAQARVDALAPTKRNVLLPAPRTGYFLPVSPAGTSTSATLGVGTLRVSPWVVEKAVTITRIGADVAVVGDVGSKFRVGIYADDGTGYPGTLVTGTDNALAGDAVAMAEATINVTLQPGLYWVGGAVQTVTTTQPTIRTVQGWSPPVSISGATLAANTTTVGYSGAGATGALPTTFPAGASAAGVTPRIHLKV